MKKTSKISGILKCLEVVELKSVPRTIEHSHD
jgi:hypothetical protein